MEEMDSGLLKEHTDELQQDLKEEGFGEDSMLVKQMVRLTRMTVRQHYEIRRLKEKLDCEDSPVNKI